ncbi:RNA polymerase sigma factor [Microbacterium tumbae]
MFNDTDPTQDDPAREAAFNRMFYEHYVRLLRYVETFVDCDGEAEVFVQEVFALAWRKFDPRRPFTSVWLRNTARNKIADAQRRRDTEERMLGERVPLTTGPHPLAPDTFERMALRRALLNLSNVEARVIEAHYTNGLSGKEIAREEGKTEDAIHAILSRARKKLRKELGTRLNQAL